MSITSNNSAVANLVSAYTSNVSSESTGALQDLFGGLSNLIGAGGVAAMLPCIISLICCIVAGIIIYYIAMSPAGQGAIKTGASVAAARAGGGMPNPANVAQNAAHSALTGGTNNFNNISKIPNA